MLSKEVTTKNGVVKNIVASDQAELDEAVKAAEAEQSVVAPDITNPKDGNVIVSPDNKAVEDVPSVVDNALPREIPEDPKPEKAKKVPVRVSKNKK